LGPSYSMFEPTPLIIALSYAWGIRRIKKMPFKILFSLTFTIISLFRFPFQKEFKFHNFLISSCITLLAMSGPLFIKFYKHLKFKDLGYFYKPKDDIYTLIHCLLTGPFCEELVFRHVIFQILGNNITQALIFGIVHFNPKNLTASLFQVCFTFVFGIWAGFLKINFGIEGCIISHLICNWIGFPDFDFFITLDGRYIILVFLLQIAGFYGAINLFPQ
jgi:membrane protease YdiL (CAAX protease family)